MNSPYSNAVINIFSKLPVPGQVKTRLIPALGAEQAADLYQLMLMNTFSTVKKSSIEAIRLCYTPDAGQEFFSQYVTGNGISVHKQSGDDLGQRMYHAIDCCLIKHAYCIVVGCDCPTLTADDLHHALHLLETNDVVLGPARDGGYYLIACKQADSRLFENIEWGTETVFAETEKRLKQLNLKWQCLREQNDLDSVEDLEMFKEIDWLRPFLTE